MNWLALLTIKNHVVRGTNFVNRHTFREMLYKVIRFFKNLGNMAAEQALRVRVWILKPLKNLYPHQGWWVTLGIYCGFLISCKIIIIIY